MTVQALGLVALATGVAFLWWWFRPPKGDLEPISAASLQNILRIEANRRGDGPTQ